MSSQDRTRRPHREEKHGQDKTNVEQSPDHHTQSHITDYREKEYRAPSNYPSSVTCSKRVSKPKSRLLGNMLMLNEVCSSIRGRKLLVGKHPVDAPD